MAQPRWKDEPEDPRSADMAGQMGRTFRHFLGTGDFPVPATRIETLRARGFSNDEIYRIVAPRRTLARRKEQDSILTIGESDRVLRLERISDMADRVFGNAEKAHRWLRKKNRALEQARPIDLLESETGAHIVEEELHRIDFGMFA